jgi:hypothetical protein
MSKQLNKKEEDRNIVIKVNPKIMVPLVGFFLCAPIGGWLGWWLATPFFIPSIGTIRWPFPTTATIVVCALIACLVGCVVCRCCYFIVKKYGTPLHEAASWGHKEVAELLIDNGADVNVKNGFGQTPLHKAARWGRKEVAELLIAKSADVNAKDMVGKTPLDRAIKYKRTETADPLRKHGGKTKKELEAAGK